MMTRLIIPFFILLLTCTIANAKMYKWVDENNKIHYSQIPPTNVDSKEVKPPLKAASTAEEERQRYKNLNQQITKAKTKKLEQIKSNAEKLQRDSDIKANCQQAKGRLVFLQSTQRIKMPNSEGKVVYISKAQRQQEITKAKNKVNEYCADNI